ncbi:DMT family transporter [Clostridium senegalense]|uniref:DMT family transporter n=1 Tax=Clostridium senegalense TaxID=1465809 RepID=UPI001C11CBC3|nr:DMT family transporter [Clostridium senegalense]MBU5227615.1 DMT family transporter [Clostridium senegalense]
MYNILALFIGSLISVMITFNSQLEGKVGSMYSLIIIHLVGLIAIILIMIIKRESVSIKRDVPKYLFLGGAVGVALTLSNIITIGGIGVTLTTSLAVFGQLIFSSCIDHYGLFGMKKYKFNIKKLMGFTIIIVGLIVMTIG